MKSVLPSTWTSDVKAATPPAHKRLKDAVKWVKVISADVLRPSARILASLVQYHACGVW